MKEDNLARRPIWAREIASSTLAFHKISQSPNKITSIIYIINPNKRNYIIILNYINHCIMVI